MDYEIRQRLQRLEEQRRDISVLLDVAAIKAELAALEARMAAPGFWDQPQEAGKTSQRFNQLQQTIKQQGETIREIEGIAEVATLLTDGEDPGEFVPMLAEVEKKVAEYLLAQTLNEPHDASNAIVTIHPGAGGTESCDWAAMLLRMYLRWAANGNYATEVWDEQPGDEAGIKNATVLISGPHAYGYLKAERGVHRLVRISPFDANARRHTSFASVHVMPELDDTAEVELDEKDLRIDTYRSSGAGGQHVNKTSSAVRITHLPTGIVVQCQNERSQYKNKSMAMKMLRARLFELQEQKHEAELAKIGGDKQAIAWGSQIRSYVFCPYTMVKDHRTDVEMGDVGKVMDGYLEPFIAGYLKWRVASRARK